MAEKRAVPSPVGFPSMVTIPVRFRDLDAMGHVNNAVYLTYFEVGRQQYMEDLGLSQQPSRSFGDTFPFIVAEITVTYLAPATTGDTLVVHTRIAHIGRKSFRVEYLVTKQGTGDAVATGHSAQVFYDYERGAPMEPPEELLDRIERLEGHSVR